MPWSFAGTAWFAGLAFAVFAVLTGPLIHPTAASGTQRAASWSLLCWLARVGGGVSLGLLLLMAVVQRVCLWCVATHGAGLAWWFVVETIRRRAARAAAQSSIDDRSLAPSPFSPVAFTSAAAFLATLITVTALLTSLQAARDAVRAEEAARAEAAMIDAAAARRADANTPPGSLPAPGSGPVAATPSAAGAPSSSPASGTDRLGGRWRFGPASAPIDVVVFSDYQCPDCRRVDQSIEQLLDRPDVAVTPRHFPLCSACNRLVPTPIHPDACRRALLAEAAGQAGGSAAFRAAHAALFAAQDETTFAASGDGAAPPSTDDPLIRRVAEATGLAAADLVRRMAAPDTAAAVAHDIDDAVALGVTFTPMVFVNGHEWKWYQSRDTLLSLVERVAAASLPRVEPPSALQKLVDDWRSARSVEALPAAAAADDDARGYRRRIGPTEQAAGAVPAVAVWVDYTVPGTAILERELLALGNEGLAFDLTVYQFPASKQCNPMIGLQDGKPESCVGALAMAAAAAVGDAQALAATHDWLIAHPNEIALPGLGAVWDQFPGRRRVFLQAYSDARSSDAVRRACGLLLARHAVTAVPTIMIGDRVVPRWEHPGATPRDVLRAIIRAAAGESAASASPAEPASAAAHP